MMIAKMLMQPKSSAKIKMVLMTFCNFFLYTPLVGI